MMTQQAALANANYYERINEPVIASFWRDEADKVARGVPYACTAHYQCRGGLVGCFVNGEWLIPGCDR